MKVVVRRLAKLDLAEACRWYDEQRAGLGGRFRDATEELFVSLRDYPHIYPRVSERVRRAAVRGFPYGAFFVIDEDTVRVIAVIHNARSPEHWRLRR